jgi:hypothetical protein
MKLSNYKILYSSNHLWAIYFFPTKPFILKGFPIEKNFKTYKEAKKRRYEMLAGYKKCPYT